MGHIGLICNGGKDKWALMAGDSVWSSTAYRENRPPSKVTKFIHTGGWNNLIETIGKLHDLHLNRPDIKIIPSHCSEIYNLCIRDKKPLFIENIPKSITSGMSFFIFI